MLKAAFRVQQEMVDRLAEIRDRPGQRRRRDARPLAVADMHQPHPLQVLHRLAHRRPANAVERHQLALGRQKIARHPATGLDLLQDPFLY